MTYLTEGRPYMSLVPVSHGKVELCYNSLAHDEPTREGGIEDGIDRELWVPEHLVLIILSRVALDDRVVRLSDTRDHPEKLEILMPPLSVSAYPPFPPVTFILKPYIALDR